MRIIRGVLLLVLVIVLTACGEASQEKVLKKVDKAWTGADGYEIEATMEMQTGTEPKKYKIEVWHTEPEFYKVEVNDENDVAQLILRNEEGVFVVTPSTNKSYKFQSEWPHKNSQAYLLEGLLQQIKSDPKAEMTEKDKAYEFIVSLQGDKSGLPAAKITIDKKTLKPKEVVLLDETEKEQVSIKFEKTEYSSKHSKEDYALENYSENKENEDSGESKEDGENKETENTPDIKNTTSTYYPLVDLQAQLADEQTIEDNGVVRTVLSYTGDKSFTLVQQPLTASNEILPVFAPGDPAHVGAVIGAMTDTSISWQQYGKEFFIASKDLTMEELLQVAGSLTQGSMK
ncbi:MAG: outer membrane lipoprotein carrier protein LolA [Lysinibacillus sp.]